MRLLICAGGTGGGVYPALSILQALQTAFTPNASSPDILAAAVGSVMIGSSRGESETRPNQRAWEQADLHAQTLWVGGIGGMEEALVRRAGIDFEAIPAAGVHGVGLRTLPGNLLKLARGTQASWAILRRFKPDVLLFTGGYVAVPMAVAARLPIKGQRRPRSLVYIPDIEPGMALNALLRLADQAALTTEESRTYLPAGLPATVSGYPVRSDLLEIASRADRAEARQALGLGDNLPVLLVWGGSKGARSINRAVLGALPQLLASTQIVHLSGSNDWDEVHLAHESLDETLRQRYHPMPYLHEMGAALAAADLVLSRAGASSLGEYPLFGLPAILVPYPYAWRYQRVNAEYLVQRGAARMVRDDELASQIVEQVNTLMTNHDQRAAMSQAMRSLAHPQAGQKIADDIVRLAAAPRSGGQTWSA